MNAFTSNAVNSGRSFAAQNTSIHFTQALGAAPALDSDFDIKAVLDSVPGLKEKMVALTNAAIEEMVYKKEYPGENLGCRSGHVKAEIEEKRRKLAEVTKKLYLDIVDIFENVKDMDEKTRKSVGIMMALIAYDAAYIALEIPSKQNKKIVAAAEAFYDIAKDKIILK